MHTKFWDGLGANQRKFLLRNGLLRAKKNCSLGFWKIKTRGNKSEEILHAEAKLTFKKVEKDIMSGHKTRINKTIIS